MPDFRRGTEAIREAQENKGGGNFRPFVPTIRWTEDKESRYLLFLTPAEDIPLIYYHEFIPVGEWESKDGSKSGTRYGFYISRKDPGIGEDYDPLEDDFEPPVEPKQRNVAVAVELEAVVKKVKGRNRPSGFKVKTVEFERRVGDGDETETVTAPVIGVVAQSPHNFFGWIGSFNDNTAAITEVPVQVTRRGTDSDTKYDFVPYLDQKVDLSAVIEFIDGITYLEDDLEDLLESIEKMEDDSAVATIADALLAARLDELADLDRYKKEVAKVKRIKSFGTVHKRVTAAADEDADDGSDDAEEAEEKPQSTRRRRAAAKRAEPKDEESGEEAEAETDGKSEDDEDTGDERRRRFDQVRARAAERSKATA